MKVAITGIYLGTKSGKTKEGKEWICSDIYSDGQTVKIYGLDLSKSGKKPLTDTVTVPCDLYGQNITVRLSENT